jgi:hypothetical protein
MSSSAGSGWLSKLLTSNVADFQPVRSVLEPIRTMEIHQNDARADVCNWQQLESKLRRQRV